MFIFKFYEYKGIWTYFSHIYVIQKNDFEKELNDSDYMK